MTKVEILELYIKDLESKVEISPARDNRISMLKDELKQASNSDCVNKSKHAVNCSTCKHLENFRKSAPSNSCFQNYNQWEAIN